MVKMFGRSLFRERGLLAGAARLFVDHARLLPLLDVADDDAVADHHLQRIDGTAGGERIDIGRLDPVLGRVAEDLGDSCSQCRARDRDVDIDAEADRFRVGPVLLQKQGAGLGVTGLKQAGLLRRCRPARLETHQQGHEGDQHHRDALRQKEQSDHDESAQPGVFVAVDCVVIVHLACSQRVFDDGEHRSGEGDRASRMIGNDPPRPARAACRRVAKCGFVLVCPPC
ncbi:hypothetical protein ACVWZW_008744 [Bradyrhizobium sp. F1.13.4]